MLNVGMVGVGAISGIYLKNLTETFREVRLVAVCDLIRERAQKAYETYQIPKIYDTMEELFADPEIDIVLNLTRPYQHYAVSKAALEAGKHVFTEKPLATTLEDGMELVQLAQAKGLRIGGAPDTFMGAGIQTCRKILDSGILGEPLMAFGAMMGHGMETWHPDPEFYYKPGGGPMMDMGPYYVTALVNLLGEVDALYGSVKRGFDTRTITSASHFGDTIDVEVPTTYNGVLEFSNGVHASLITTFDVYAAAEMPNLEIYCTEGTLVVPDPNLFRGPVLIRHGREKGAKEVPLMFGYSENSRALGLADMAKAIETGRNGRASAQQVLHVLEILTGFEKSAKLGQKLKLQTSYHREAPMVNSPVPGVLD